MVALKSETGELAWSFQTVHHDVWDYDLPAQPTLARIDTGEGMRDVVIQPTKQGFVFVLDRDTGKPVWPVEERAVPQGGAEGEKLSPTQPFPTHVPPLLPQQFSLDDEFKFPPVIGSPSCHALLAGARNDGLYTPPSTQGTLEFPDDRRRRELGQRGVRSRAPDPLRQHHQCRASGQADAARRKPRATTRRRVMISAGSAARRLR